MALRPALLFGAASMAGALLGARLATVVSGAVQLFLFAIVMLMAAAFMLRGRTPGFEETGTPARPGVILPVGVGLGILTGLVGVGGGFLIVPALVLLAGLRMKQAVGTSLAVIAMNSTTGLAGYLGQVEFDWGVIAGFIIASGSVNVLDVRGAAEWEAGHLPGVPNVPVGYLEERLAELPAGRPLVVHCQGGARSAIAASLLQAHGFPSVVNLTGGYQEWVAGGHPVEREEAAAWLR